MKRFIPHSTQEFNHINRRYVVAARHIVLSRIRGAKPCFFVEKRSGRWKVYPGKMMPDPHMSHGHTLECDVFYSEKTPIIGYRNFYSTSMFRRRKHFNPGSAVLRLKMQMLENLYRRLGGCSHLVFMGHSISVVDINNTTFLQRDKLSSPPLAAVTKPLAQRLAHALNNRLWHELVELS
jgi:hypothetical protein